MAASAPVGSPSRTRGYEMLMEELLETPRPGCFQRVSKRLFGALSGVGIAALSATAIVWDRGAHSFVRSVGYLAAGFGVQTAFDFAVQGDDPADTDARKTLHVAHKILSIVGTQAMLFTLTQFYKNTADVSAQEGIVDTILALGGAEIAREMTRAIERGWVILMESSVPVANPNRRPGPTFQEVFLAPRWVYGLETATALACGAVWWADSSDPLAKDFAVPLGSFFALGIIGEGISSFVQHKVQRFDQKNENPGQGEVVGTNWRVVRLVCDTTGMLLPFCLLIPMKRPWSVLAGGAFGLINGMSRESFKERLRCVPIADLDELQPAPDLPIQNLAYRCFKIACPIIAILGFSCFVIYEDLERLPNESQKRDLGVVFGSTLAAFGVAHGVDLFWNAKKRAAIQSPNLLDKALDQIMTTLVLNPRLPLLIFFIGTNSFSIDSENLGRNDDLSYQVAAAATWGLGYGPAMALEFQQALSDKLGGPFKVNVFFLANVLQTAQGIINKRG